MTAHPRGQAGRHRSSFVNRSVQLTGADSNVSSPDVLTQVKIAVAGMDAIEISDNASWQTRVASLSPRYRTMFDVGAFIRARYRYYIYGLDSATLNDLLSQVGPLAIPSLTKWISWAGATDTGTLSVPDRLGGAPATQSSGVLKPTLGFSDNGVRIATFNSNVLALPLSAAINDNIKFGIAFWAKIADVVGTKTFVSVQNGGVGTASASRVLINMFGATLEARAQAVDRRAGVGGLDTNWRFCYIGIDCSKGSEPAQVIISLDGNPSTVSFSSDTAWPSSLGTPTGNMMIGGTTATASAPLIGSIGDIYFFTDQVSTVNQVRLMQIKRPL